MGIEDKAQEDLALSTEDAEDVVGGAKKKAAKHAAPHPAAAAEPNMIVVSGPPNGPVTEAVTMDPNSEDC